MSLKNKKIMGILHNLIIFSFSLFFLSSFFFLLSSRVLAVELIEEAFAPAKLEETIIDLGNTKDAVGNEIFRESVGLQEGSFNILNGDYALPWKGCFVNEQRVGKAELDARLDELEVDVSYQKICAILGGTRNVDALKSRPPLIVRITKFLLRMVIVLSITMVIYTGIMYMIEASKGVEVKDARDNLLYIIGWVLLALMSLALINLITSLTVTSLNV